MILYAAFCIDTPLLASLARACGSLRAALPPPIGTRDDDAASPALPAAFSPHAYRLIYQCTQGFQVPA